MQNKILIFLIAFVSFSASAVAQTQKRTIAGKVIDEDGAPLSGATVYIESIKTGAVTNDEGKFQIDNLSNSTYILSVKFIGYETITRRVTLKDAKSKPVVFRMYPSSQSLSEVVVKGKSEARKIREQAMPVSVISMKQLQGTVSDIESVLAKTVGVTIRSTGGVGSSSRISLRGLEGKRIGFFIDETPLNDQSDFLDLNDIPIDMIDRIEIFKGIVPAKFGGSSMGGAVNIVIKEYPDRYADVSYTHESFNVNKLQTVLKRNLKNAGLIFGIGGSYTYADNDYEMESPFEKGRKLKRNHDKFKKLLLGGSLKAKKWWFDEVELEPVFLNTYHDIQGIEYDIRKAHSKSQLFGLSSKLEKSDFLIPGLDFEMSTSVAYTNYSLVDTAKVYHDWDGNAYPSASLYGGELGNRYASNSDNDKFTLMNKLNLEYIINKWHSINFNSVFTLANGYPSDDIKEKSLGKKVDFNSRMRSWVGGLSYDYRTSNDRFLNSLTGRYYWYYMSTMYRNLYVNTPAEDIHLTKNSIGFSDAMRFRFTRTLMAKLSGGYDVRIPSENELLGDGITITPSERLKPERNLSLNAGLIYDLVGIHPSNLQIELNGYYMHLKDMIRFVKGILGAQYQNFGEMRTLGVELEVKADIFPFLYGYGNITYQDLRDTRKYEEGTKLPNTTKGKRMPNIPYLLANAGLEFHRENLFGGKGQNTRLFADMAFVEEYLYDFELTNNVKRRIPRTTTFDLGFEHSFMNQRLFISGKIANLTDERVISEFNRPLPGRSLGIKLRYIFR